MFKTLRNCALTLLAMLTGCSESPPSNSEYSEPALQLPTEVRGDSAINIYLLKLLRSHGLKATTRDGWILIESCPSICGAVVRELQPTPNSKSVQIDIYLQVEPNRVLVESFAGIGVTTDEAVTNGMHNFVLNSFHVLLAAFYLDNDDQVETEHWQINGGSRHVTIGSMGIRGTTPNPDEPPIDWFKTLEAKIKASELLNGTHWVRCYYAQMENEALEVEVLLDNENWLPVRAEMTAVDWPKTEDFYSVRIFLVIQDEEK